MSLATANWPDPLKQRSQVPDLFAGPRRILSGQTELYTLAFVRHTEIPDARASSGEKNKTRRAICTPRNTQNSVAAFSAALTGK